MWSYFRSNLAALSAPRLRLLEVAGAAKACRPGDTRSEAYKQNIFPSAPPHSIGGDASSLPAPLLGQGTVTQKDMRAV
jgi:hypothetical protein